MLAGREVGLSPTTVGQTLRDRGHLRQGDGEQYLHDLWGSSATAANAQWCADEIRGAWQKREAAKVSAEAATALQAPGADLDAILDKLFSQLENAAKCSRPSGPRPMTADVENAYTQAKAAAELGDRTLGLSTGYARLDWWTSGLQKSNLIILAAQRGWARPPWR